MNKFVRLDEGTHEIQIYSKTHGLQSVIIDSEDIPRVSSFHWSVAKHKNVLYAVSHIGSKSTGDCFGIHLHRLISSFESPMVDHVNRNGLDNRKCNLRPITHKLNRVNANNPFNKCGFKGVSESTTPRGKYRARIIINGKNISLGTFLVAEDAARAYDIAAVGQYGEFAYTNFK